MLWSACKGYALTLALLVIVEHSVVLSMGCVDSIGFLTTGGNLLAGSRGNVRICTSSTLEMKTATKKSKKKGAAPAGFGSAGFGAKRGTSSTETVDAALLLRQSMDLYDKLGQEVYTAEEGGSDEYQIFKEFVISVRAGSGASPSAATQLCDWVPTACLAVEWTGPPLDDNPLLQGMADPSLALPAAVKKLRREVWESACQAAPSLSKVPRTVVEFAAEPLDNFGAILEEVKEHKTGRSAALQTLGLPKTAVPRDIKAAHRKRIVKLHPDMTADLPEEERTEAEAEFKRVQAAYETLGGGGEAVEGGSWYEGLGGKARSDYFSGALSLNKVPADVLEYWTVAVMPIEPEITIDFLMRNAMRYGHTVRTVSASLGNGGGNGLFSADSIHAVAENR